MSPAGALKIISQCLVLRPIHFSKMDLKVSGTIDFCLFF